MQSDESNTGGVRVACGEDGAQRSAAGEVRLSAAPASEHPSGLCGPERISSSRSKDSSLSLVVPDKSFVTVTGFDFAEPVSPFVKTTGSIPVSTTSSFIGEPNEARSMRIHCMV